MLEENILVSVKDDYLEKLQEVSQKLQSQGMKVHKLLDKIGIITGSIDSQKIGTLVNVEGVSAVEKDQEYHTL